MFLTIVWIFFLVVLLVGINALYVAGEFAAVGARKTRIIQQAELGNRLAQNFLPVLQDPEKLDRYIAASQVGITISSIVLGIVGENQISPLIEPWMDRLFLGALAPFVGGIAASGIAVFLVLAVLTTFQVVLGELVPKSIAMQYPERIALATAIPMKWSAEVILAPLITVLNGSGRLILRLVGAGGEDSSHQHLHSPEEIIILVKESHKAGLLDANKRRMLRNVFRVTETTVGEIVIPRTRMTAASVDQPLIETLKLASSSAYSRIPIYEDDHDHILGFVHFRDVFTLYRQNPLADVRVIIRKAPFVPETVTVIDVWQRLNEAQSYMALVVDEYGGTRGMITREDLIEELFGELQDEFDQEPALISTAGERRMVIRGDINIEYLNELLEVDLPHNGARTLAGLIQERLGRVPVPGDAIEVGGLYLEVDGVVETVLLMIAITLPPGVAAPEDIEGDL